jgi:hypothetical protein
VPLSVAVVFLTAVGIVLVQQFGAVYIWFIPISSIVAGLIAVLLVNLSLRRKVARA